MQCSHPSNSNNGLRIALEKSIDDLEGPQLVLVHSKSLTSSMVRTRGSEAGATGDGQAGQGRNKNTGAESPEQPNHNRVSFYGVAAMPVYREETPPDEEEQHSSGLYTSHNFQLSEGGISAEERQPASPMVTPPMGSYNAEVSRHTKKSPPVSSAGVPHIYHDYSRVPDETNYVRKKTGGVTQPFPEKLYEMLDEVEGTKEMSIVSWLPHGRAFLVRKPREFTEKIMPKFFRQSKLTSFQRQLNLYGFRRITQGTDAGAYYHEMFLKTRPALCQRMTRQKVKGTGHKQAADAKTEPNFYLMPPVESTSTSAVAARHNFGSSSGIASVPGFDGSSAYGGTAGIPPPASVAAAQFDYPASPGLHGAAHLLQGIASGYNSLRLPQAPVLGLSGSAAGFGEHEQDGTDQDTQQLQGAPFSFLQPRLTKPSSYESI